MVKQNILAILMLKRALIFVVLFLEASSALIPPEPGAALPGNSNEARLCDNLNKIHRIPFENEPVNDDIYNKIVQSGSAIVPCLVNRITDATKMPDPRSEPTFSDFRVGDLAFFLLVKLHKVPFEQMLPGSVRSKLKDEGVYAYFSYVSSPHHRRLLQKNVAKWLREHGPAMNHGTK